MNIREDDQVSAVALVMEEEASTAASAETLDPETVAGPADDPALARGRRRARRGRPGATRRTRRRSAAEVDADDVEP